MMRPGIQPRSPGPLANTIFALKENERFIKIIKDVLTYGLYCNDNMIYDNSKMKT